MALAQSTSKPSVSAARRLRAQLARKDPRTFAEYVLRDEFSGDPIRLAPLHEDWHRLFDAHPRLVLWAAVEHGKTSTLTGRLLWELGRNPSLRCAVVSNTHGQACKIVRTVAEYIEHSRALRDVFPRLKRGAGIWRDDSLVVQRSTMGKDASLQGYGVGGAVLGSRVDLLVLDDILSFEVARTEQQRQALYDWVMSTLLGRVTANGRVIVLGTAFHSDDLPHRLARQGWPSARFGVVDETGASRWPEKWPADRIEAKRAELGPYEAARQLDCVAISSDAAMFKPDWLEGALAAGTGRTTANCIVSLAPGSYCSVGVDLGVGREAHHDETAVVAALVHGNGTRQLLEVQAGRWRIDEITQRIVEAHRRYAGARVVVESNAAQAFVGDLVRGLGHIPVDGYTSGRGEKSLQFQAELLGKELSEGKWIFPSGAEGRQLAPEVRRLVSDMARMVPGEHTPDRVSALLMCRWGCAQGERKASWGRMDLMTR